MNTDPSVDASADRSTRTRAARESARNVVRQWTRDLDGDALGRVGFAAIRESADVVAYRLADIEAGGSTQDVLDEVRRIADAVASPTEAQPSRWWRPRKPIAARDSIAALVQRLDHERDAGARRMIALTGARSRFERGDRALGDAVLLIDALEAAIESGVREIRGSDPGRAAAMQERSATILLERRQAVTTQLAVHAQAMMTLDLMMANQQTLNSALDQARTTTLSALQVAMTAQSATRTRSTLD